jgi:predicted DNA-binding transcriptional regulator YafY
MRGDALAERLEVDTRTIRRYVTTLRDRGIPIEMERGRYGGYYLRPGYKRQLALTEREAISTVWGLLRVGQQGASVAADGSKGALAKLTHILPQATRDMVRHLERVVTIATPSDVPSDHVDVEHLKTILYAAAAHRQLHVTHRSWNGETTERLVDAYQVVYRAGRWYLVGHCHLRDDLRVFRLDHIQRATLQSDEFGVSGIQDLDALAAVERAIALVPWQWEYHVRLDLTLEDATRRIPATMASLEEDEQSGQRVIMRGYASDLAWLAHFLAGLRCPLIVVSPPELRDHLLALAEHIGQIVAEHA